MRRKTHPTLCLVLLWCASQSAIGFAQERTAEARYDSEPLQVAATALVAAPPLSVVGDVVPVYNVIPGFGIPIHGDAPDSLVALDQLVLDYMVDQRSTGLSIAVARSERLVYCKAFGYRTMDLLQPLSTDHRLRLGSVSIILTSTAELRLFEEVPGAELDTPGFGFTSLGDPSMEGLLESTDWITAMANQVDDFGGFHVYHAITPRHLMAHASGFNKTNESAWGGSDIESKKEHSQTHLANCPRSQYSIAPINVVIAVNCDGKSSDLAGLSDQVALAVAQTNLPTNINLFEPFKITRNEISWA